MTKRQRKVLLAIIEEYISSAEPVGSRTIAKKPALGVSAATVRIEMSDLEALGFLKQPHASSGRIPTQKGFRFYVDHMVRPHLFSWEDFDYSSLTYKIECLEQLVPCISHIVSHLTNCMTFVLERDGNEERLSSVQLIPLEERLAVAILVTNTGRVYQHKLELPHAIDGLTLEKLLAFLNDKLRGITLLQLERVKNEVQNEIRKYIEQYEQVSGVLDKMLVPMAEDKLYTSGATHLLQQPEFRDPDRLQPFLALLEQEQKVIKWLDSGNDGLEVKIGTEHDLDLAHHCTLVTSSYLLSGSSRVIIAVVGPMRMNYAQVLGLMDSLTTNFNDVATLFLGQERGRSIG
ncbi:MAG: hypothetical protein RLZ12_212 [Bacillota bacterium]